MVKSSVIDISEISINEAQKEPTGSYLLGDVVNVLKSQKIAQYKGKVQLIVTSPPFPLNKKKSYGNHKGDEYLDWLTSLAPLFADMLTDDGSIVIEVGNSWEPGRPVQSLLPLKALMSFIDNEEAELRLIQEFVCYNPSRLPSPAQWVTINRIRTVDSYTHVWWMSKTDYPKADNSRVLRPYSKRMKELLKRGDYNSGKRPSQHKISEDSFLKDCGGSIAHNFFEMEMLETGRELRLPNAFSFSNTSSNDFYTRECKSAGLTPHPARMPMGLAAFFIQYLTEPGDLVLDPFAGSNTTGYAAARLDRKWLSIDAQEQYIEHSKIRFSDPILQLREST